MNLRPSILGVCALALAFTFTLQCSAQAGEAAPTVEEYSAELQKDQAAFERISQTETTFAQSIEWLSGEIERAKRPDALRPRVSYHFDEVFRLACTRATDAELGRLRGIILALPDRGFEFENSFDA